VFWLLVVVISAELAAYAFQFARTIEAPVYAAPLRAGYASAFLILRINFSSRSTPTISALSDSRSASSSPSLEGVEEVVISKEVVEGTARPLYIYADRADRAGDASAS
jgi:hypothetical protein